MLTQGLGKLKEARLMSRKSVEDAQHGHLAFVVEWVRFKISLFLVEHEDSPGPDDALACIAVQRSSTSGYGAVHLLSVHRDAPHKPT